jgi:hypothetical protein
MQNTPQKSTRDSTQLPLQGYTFLAIFLVAKPSKNGIVTPFGIKAVWHKKN